VNLTIKIAMKKIIGFQITLALLLAAAPLASKADTTFFSDNFSNGSTLNSGSPVAPTSTSASYELISTKQWYVPTTSIAPGHLTFGISNSTAGTVEVQALFASPAVALVSAGDYIQLAVTFTDTQGLLIQTTPLGFGMYNAGGVSPIGGGLNGTADSGTHTAEVGGARNWKGYVALIGYTGGHSGFLIRTNQNGGGTVGNNDQDLVTSGSSTKSYYNPKAVWIHTNDSASVTLTVGYQYTEILTYTLTSTNTLQLDSRLYTGTGNTGTLLSTMSTNTGVPPLTTVFDGLAFGWYANQNPAVTNTLADINSITVSGVVHPPTGPPTINTQPLPVSVATNGSCAFSVSAIGVGVTYQWCRNGTNLLDNGNISGSTSSLLAISSAGPADALSGANGYYVTVSGAGNYSTNSTTNSLTLMPSTNLTWTAAGGNVWDLNSTASWNDNNNNPTVFNYGDPVTFNDTAGTKVVNLSGAYLSAASVTVDTAIAYTFQGDGSFAGPGSLMFKGSGQLTLNNVNTYTGGTIISNATAFVYLKNYNGLGNGPVTLAKAGGSMEIVSAGNASTGINGDIVVADDFTIQFDGLGTYSGVLFGNLSGTAGKTLTLTQDTVNNTTTNNRVRVYGTNTTYNAKLVLGSLITLAPYNASGSQTYNGVISGAGGLIQRDSGTTILNGANTYSGGTTPTTGAIGFGIDTVGAVTTGPIGTGPLYLAPEIPNLTSSGMVFASGGTRTIANLIQYPSGTNNLTLIIGGTNNLTLTGAFTLKGNDGLTSNTITARIVQVTNTGLTAISSVISDGGAAYGFIKTGSGILALNNTETYTGPTTISNGTLWVNGQLNSASAVTVATNGILGGTGIVNGSVTVQQGGAIAPGTNTIGTNKIIGNLTLGGNVNVRINRSGFASDEVNVTGTPSFSGTGYVIVTNTGAALQPGDTFHVFNKGVTGAGSMYVGGGGVAWNNQLAANGTIVVSTVGLPHISTTVSNSTLTLSWPAAYPGWEVQSNRVDLASSTNWFTVPNTASSTSYAVTLNSARTNVFYRLVFP
jgi:autotransporter-associated beta strand protein